MVGAFDPAVASRLIREALNYLPPETTGGAAGMLEGASELLETVRIRCARGEDAAGVDEIMILSIVSMCMQAEAGSDDWAFSVARRYPHLLPAIEALLRAAEGSDESP